MDIIQQYLLRTDDFFVAERVNNIITIFFGAQVMLVTDLNDLTEVKRAIVQLKKIKISTHTISRIFSICRETIDKWFETYQKYGFKTLEKIKHGPKKVTDEIEAYIIFKAKELNFCSAYRKKILEGIKNHFNVKFHVNTISDILRKNKIDISIKKFNKKLEEKENPNNKIDSLKLENLGLLLIFPFLKKFELEKLFFNAQSIFKNKYYSALDYIYTLIILLSVNLIQVEENIKNLKDKNLGVLIGKNNIPCAKTLRKNINTIISNTDMRKFQISLCRNYFNENSNLNELYIDGHFFPYFGSSNIFKGYNSSRRLAMKGKTGYFINNIEGRPFFYILSDEYKGFREFLYEIAENLRQIRTGATVDKLIMVFDRGGYGEELCNDMKDKSTFICWKSGKLKLPEKIKWKKIIINHQSNKYGEDYLLELQAVELEVKDKNKKIIGRNIWIKKGDKISPAYTNDKCRTLEELVKIITRRWGAQENVFKSLKRIGIDKISTYQKELYPDDWLIEEDRIRKIRNPEKLIIKDKIINLKNEIEKIKITLANHCIVITKKNKIETLKNKINEFMIKLNGLKTDMKNLPDRINITKYISEKGIERLSGEKKCFMDLIKILSYNVKQDIVDFIRPVYKNQRDVNNFVTFLLRKSGEIKISDTHIDVIFEKYKSMKETNTLMFLCDQMNKQDFVHPLMNKKIRYHVI